MRNFLIDSDTASDDAVALIMALNYPNVNVEAITIVAGNVEVEQGVKNALYTVELCKKNVMVYQGASKPLVRKLQTAKHKRGQDGMSDIGLEFKKTIAAEGNAIDVIINTVYKFPNEIEIVALGPLTNIAIAIAKEPNIVKYVKSCTIMGGMGYGYGNITPASEYNIWADPESAQIVFQSGMHLKMIGWDITRHHAWFDNSAIKMIKSLNTPLAHFSMDIQKAVADFNKNLSGAIGFHLPDPITMAIALDKSVETKSKKLYVKIDLSDTYTRGQTIVDHAGVTRRKPNVEVVLEASTEKFLSIIKSTHK